MPLASLALVLALCGCHLVLPLEGGSPVEPDAGDVGTVDLLADGPRTDLGPDVDAVQPTDQQLADLSTPKDLPAQDLPTPDMLVDAPIGPDTTNDGPPPPDANLGDAPAGPCGYGAVQVYSYSGSKPMIVCKGAAVTQCQASTLCGSAWHLCTASEFLARGGTALGFMGTAWIQSCIRTNNKVSAPTDTICPSCVYSTSIIAEVMWDCSGSGFGNSFTTAQLTPTISGVCERLGIDDPSTAGFWYPSSASTPRSAAACCPP